ncbi:MAG TPA: type IV pilin, partial [Candidatus Thermoplasmatota archaeon]|nr:type IV pilin [Candidatus Thermoplasmatota archaeon]
DEAVSPVIGVILMVAITVVLAAVVFVLVSNLSKGGSQSAPTLAINTDDTADRLVITSAATGADWSRLSIQTVSCTQTAIAASVTGSIVYMGNDAAATSPTFQNELADDGVAGSAPNNLPAGASLNSASTGTGNTACGGGLAKAVTTTPTAIQAGDYLAFCVSNGSGLAATTVVLSITDTVANSQIGQYTFTNLAKCL